MSFVKIKTIIVMSSIFLNSTAFAVQMKLNLKSNVFDSLPTVNKIIDLVDPNDQFAIAGQAGLLAMSSEGWDFANFGSILEQRKQPEWTGSFYILFAPINEKSPFNFFNVPDVQFFFHTDEWAARYSHNICERENNFGTISSSWGLNNSSWSQCSQPDWGSFWVEPITETGNSVPEPSTMVLLGSGLVGLIAYRRKMRR